MSIELPSESDMYGIDEVCAFCYSRNNRKVSIVVGCVTSVAVVGAQKCVYVYRRVRI